MYESDIAQVEVGQSVVFRISNTEAPVFPGRITAIGTEADRNSRTTRVRAQIANTGGRLRANVFGRARIEITAEHEAVLVPFAQSNMTDEKKSSSCRRGQADTADIPSSRNQRTKAACRRSWKGLNRANRS